MTQRIVLIGMLAVLGAARIVEAANDTSATSWQAFLGEKRSQSLTSPTPGYYKVRLTGGHSYAAICWTPFFESGSVGSGACGIEIRNFSDVSVGTFSSNEPFPNGGAVAVFTPADSLVSSPHFVRITSTFGGSTVVNMIMIETTLASPWYFTSPGVYEAFAEIRNNTTATVNVTVRAYAGTGGTTPTNSTNVAIPPNGNAAVLVNGGLGITGSGSLTITHDALPGGVVANVTTIGALTGLSFDAPFTPRMIWSINGAGQ